jgi:RNA polymerase sigma-70 factor (ECF subfamily)
VLDTNQELHMTVSLETVYRDFDSGLRKFIRRRINDKDASEDILQEVYIKIHDNIGNLRDTKRLSFWIYQITRNAIIDQYRRDRPGAKLTEDLTAPQIEEPDLYAELASSVRGMLDCLPADYRQALLLADLQGMKQNEVARHLGLSLSGAKSRIQRARQKLKQAFLDCCHFEFDHNGRLMDFQSNCDRCADRQSQSTCKDESCEDTHHPPGPTLAD